MATRLEMIDGQRDCASVLRGAGFTLVELMVTVSIVVILATLATPSFIALLTNNRISAQANDVLSSINLARSEAVTRGHGVSLCASSDGATCAGTDLSAGWVIFDDVNANGGIDAGDAIIRTYQAMDGQTTATFVATPSSDNFSLSFLGVGRPVGAFGGAVGTVCPPLGGDYCRYICINSQGRPRVDTPAQYAVDARCGN